MTARASWIVVVAVFFTAPLHAEMRSWKDVQGRTVEAEMVDLRGGKLIMKLPTGKEIAFPFNLLSEADRAWVRENAPINPREAAREIDLMILEKLKSENAGLRQQMRDLAGNDTLSRSDKLKKLADLKFRETMTHPTPRTSDEQFARRVYLDIAGRIPTYEEIQKFLTSSDKFKRDRLIDELLDSEAFVSHFFNYLSDLIRVRDGISMGGFDTLKSGAYAEWIKDQVRTNRPWNELVSDLVAARGHFWNNPATGYLLTDFGMELCNLSNTFTIFTGTEITCAQCHDHPFEEVYQLDFFKLASFFGNTTFESPLEPDFKAVLSQKHKEIAARAKKEKKDIRVLETIFRSYNLHLGDTAPNSVRLPDDYRYDDADPRDPVRPSTYFGDVVEVEEFETPRQAFAHWLVSKENPRFTINIANRMWKHVFGLGQIEPVDNIPGHLDGQAQNYELLKYLESLMKEVDFRLVDFLRVLYKTQTYQRESCHNSPTLTMIDKGEYHFPAPVLRRMSAEQMWDSIVAMAEPDPEANTRRILGAYRELMNTEWAHVDYDHAFQLQNRYRTLGQGGMMMGGNGNNQGKGPAPLYRASEMPLPAPVGSFLYTFGQSDKRFIENSSKVGTIPQVMIMLNGELTNKAISHASRQIVKNMKEARSTRDAVDTCFLSVLSRRPQPGEMEYAEKLVRGDDYSDLIWTLVNLHEFMFIQ